MCVCVDQKASDFSTKIPQSKGITKTERILNRKDRKNQRDQAKKNKTKSSYDPETLINNSEVLKSNPALLQFVKQCVGDTKKSLVISFIPLNAEANCESIM